MTSWTAVDGSVRGASHEARNTPNQDAIRTSVLANGRGVIGAVSDGHGGARYVRSDVGARFAVEIACDQLRAWWTDARAGHPSARLERSLRDDVVPAITAAWRERVLAHLTSNSFTAAETEQAGIPLEPEPLIAYGATLLLALATERTVALAQLGDGDIVVVNRNSVTLPIAPDDRLVASQTTSLCLDDAEQDFRVAVVDDLDLVQLVLLSSDGYANSFADDHWEESVGRDLADRLAEDGIESVHEKLATWLGESAAASGDDVSVVLLVPNHTDDAPELTPIAATPTPESPAPARVSSGIGRLLTFAFVALLLGGAVGWVIGNATSSTTSATTNGAVTTTSAAGTGGGPGRARSTIVTPTGLVVSFVADPAQPAPKVATEAGPVGAVTRLTVNNAVWEVTSDGQVTVTTFGAAAPITMPFAVGSIAAVGDSIWAVDVSGSKLAAVNAASHQVSPATDVAGRTQSSVPANSVAPTTAGG